MCEDLGATAAAPCPEGFICPAGTSAGEKMTNLCPEGGVCPAGSSTSQPCAVGTFAPYRGMSKCLTCPAGFFCKDPSVGFDNQPCPAGHFCIEGRHWNIACDELAIAAIFLRLSGSPSRWCRVSRLNGRGTESRTLPTWKCRANHKSIE